MHPRFALFLLALVVALPSFAQEQTGAWDYYLSAHSTGSLRPDIVRDGDATWIASGLILGHISGGLIRIDRQTGRTTTYTTFNSGLPSSRIADLALGADGGLWVGIEYLTGSAGAVVYFHEGTWKVFDASNTPEMQGEIADLHVDADGVLWVGTYDGLLRFDGIEWTSYTSENSGMSLSYARAIDSAEDGVIWVAGWGLARFDGTEWEVWTSENSDLPNDGMLSLAVTGPDEVWAGTQQEGLIHLDAGTVTQYERDEWPMSTIRVDELVVAPDGSVWGMAGNLFRIVDNVLVEVEQEGLGVGGPLTFEGDTLWSWMGVPPAYDRRLGYAEVVGGTVTAPTTYTIGPDDNWLPAVAWGPDGALWYGTQIAGVGRFDGTDWTHWHPYWTGLPDGRIVDLAFDREGNLWAAPFAGGPARFDGEAWTEYTDGLPVDMSGTQALAIVAQSDDTEVAWAALERCCDEGQGSELARFDGSSWEVLTPSGIDLFSTFVTALAGDADGIVWLGTSDLGVVRFDGQEWTVFSVEDGLPASSIRDITADASGVWAVTYAGLAHYDGTAWTTVPTATTGVSYPAGVAADPLGGVWVGGASAAAKFDGETWTSFTAENAPLPPADSLGGVPFVSIAPGPGGRVAFGTSFGGLFLYDPASPVGVEPAPSAAPASLLEPSFPNPTAGMTTVRFHVPPQAHRSSSVPVQLDVLDILGRRVATLVATWLEPGRHEFRLDASDLPSGVYLCRLSVGQAVATQRLTVLH